MAAIIPGRTDNEIKNFWHTHLKKRSKKIPAPAAQSSSPSQITLCKNVNSEERESSENYENFQTSEKLILESSETMNSPNPAVVVWDSEESASSSHSARDVQESTLSEERVTAENCDNQIELNFNDGFVESFWSQPFVMDTSYSHDHSFTPLMEEEAAIYLFT